MTMPALPSAFILLMKIFMELAHHSHHTFLPGVKEVLSDGTFRVTDKMMRFFLVLLCLGAAASFQVTSICRHNAISAHKLRSLKVLTALRKEDDFGMEGDKYEGDIDWDGEWKKVVEEKGNAVDRPGKDFYKNDIERAVTKTGQAAIDQIESAKNKLPDVKFVKPNVNMQAMSGDGKVSTMQLTILLSSHDK